MHLAALLERQILQDASVLDEKLADYVFFPLSNILRNQKEYPIRLTEVTIKCFRNLVEFGWKSKLPKELAQQLLLLLTFIIAGVPGQARQDRIPEETELESFRAIGSLVKASGSSPTSAAALVEEKAIPALGHAVTVLLDGINSGRTPTIQLEALQALSALVVAIKDQTTLATFLPGIVSSLSKLLTPSGALRVQKKVLVQGINTLRDVLTKVLGDIKVRGIMKKSVDDGVNSDSGRNILSNSWLNATVAKVRLALASVLKLRTDSSGDVQAALGKLCITLLDECHQSLSDATLILVETAMIVGDGHDNESMYETGLADLARIYPELADAVKTTVYNWLTSLPRLVQSSDEKVKQQAMQNLLKGQHFITTLQIDSSILDDSLAASLRDSAIALVVGSKPGSGLSEIIPSNALELSSTNTAGKLEIEAFPPVLIARETERSRAPVLSTSYLKLGPFELIKSTLTHSSELDDFLDFSMAAETSDGSDSALQELYTFSVSILDSQAEANDIDWRMQALSLEITTFVASRMQEGFRPELVDVLYPIATFLGSSNPQLRQHAIISLNNITAACRYQKVTDLIIENVDYMVNSVSLRLNTFDISPASTQVLRMMIRLTGPRLIPYLDDVIESIFAALDNYHGYTIFVESLFSVLTEVVQQGVKSNNLLLEESPKSVNHKKYAPTIVSTSDLCKVLDRRHERQSAQQQEELELKELKRHPNHSFKATDATKIASEGDLDHGGESGTEIEKPAPPKTRTLQLLSRITISTESPCDGVSSARPDEEEFLPLVNAVWPVLIGRLYDPETFVAIAACEALCALCAAAGNFLSTRFKTEWWDNGLGKWCGNIKEQALRSQGRVKHRGRGHVGAPTTVLPFGGNREGKITEIVIPTRADDGELQIRESNEETASSTGGGGGGVGSLGLGRFAQIAQLWEAVQGLLIAIVTYINIDDDIFDQVLPLLGDALESQNSAAREALEAVDADAVWLFMYERGMLQVEPSTYPIMAGVKFVEV
ncbi:hypothetical protein RRF57_005335 [Xylaria bambusicola]|uniref:TEL2-interacting protein 1 n=1 Tax=Xylaria bambusicola TaxID=326684 RepID=A0AAN7UCE6_9PEZI